MCIRDSVDGMPKLTQLNALVGKFVNLEYRRPNGNTVKFLDDNATYLGNQLECEFGGDRYFGIVANKMCIRDSGSYFIHRTVDRLHSC